MQHYFFAPPPVILKINAAKFKFLVTHKIFKKKTEKQKNSFYQNRQKNYDFSIITWEPLPVGEDLLAQ